LDKDFFAFLKNKRYLKILLIALIGIGLIIASSLAENKKSASHGAVADEISLDEYRARLESEVAELCSSVSGVGKCRVFITFERGEQNTYKGTSVIETKPPRVLGVSVVCRGADSDSVRAELVDMLSALFDIGANRIAILKLNS
jgi:stage III sporulation protein AG